MGECGIGTLMVRVLAAPVERVFEFRAGRSPHTRASFEERASSTRSATM